MALLKCNLGYFESTVCFIRNKQMHGFGKGVIIMQELIINVLLMAVVLTAAGFLVTAEKRRGEMTKKQKKMLI